MKTVLNQRGQLIAAVLLLLIIMGALVPIMVLYTQREAQWTVKQGQSTTAFHMAEAGTEKAFAAISLSTQVWANLINGKGAPAGFNFDTNYLDITGGTYAVSITSGPKAQQATIISVGRDNLKKETRAIQAVYSNSPLGNDAIISGGGVGVSGNNLQIEWGAVLSPDYINAGSKLHPQYWSASSITAMGYVLATPVPPTCDQPNCWWLHAWVTNMPPLPTIDFSFYKSSAIAAGAGPGTCGNHYQAAPNPGWNCTDTSGNPYYFEQNVTFGGGHVIGTVIVLGDFDTSNGTLGGASETVPIPAQAWKQYSNDWAYFQTNFCASANNVNASGTPLTIPASYCPAGSFPGLNAGLDLPTPLVYYYNISPVFHGLLYINGNFTGPQGGGNSTLGYGVLYVKGFVNLNSNSHVYWYYGADAANSMQLTDIILTRTSWQDLLYPYPFP